MSASIHLLGLADLRLLRADPSSALGRRVVEGALPPDFILTAALAALERGGRPQWSSFFVFVDGEDGAVAGSGGFKSPPRGGVVEIGYGVAPARRGRGVATSAVRRIVALGLACEEVDVIVAETAVDNVASRRVVEKAGFAWRGAHDTPDDGPVHVWRIAAPGREGSQ